MSTSSLSELSEAVFENPSTRPSKRIKLSYGKHNRHRIYQVIHNRNRKRHLSATNSPSQSGVQLTPSQQDSSQLNIDTTSIPTLELQHLRQNNAFLRQQNVSLARSQTAAQTQMRAAREEARAAKEEVAKLKRHEELRSAIDSGALDAARRIDRLEEYRRTYWECNIEWAKIEKRLEAEKELLKREVSGLMARVRELEGRVLEGERGNVISPRKERELGMVMGQESGGGMMNLSNEGVLAGWGMADGTAESDVKDVYAERSGSVRSSEIDNLAAESERGFPLVSMSGTTMKQEPPVRVQDVEQMHLAESMSLSQQSGLDRWQGMPGYHNAGPAAFLMNNNTAALFTDGNGAYDHGWDQAGDTGPQFEALRFDPMGNVSMGNYEDNGFFGISGDHRW